MKVELGLKEITAICAAIPVLYCNIRKLKIKYDKKEARLGLSGTCGNSGVVFQDIFIDADGNTWRRES